MSEEALTVDETMTTKPPTKPRQSRTRARSMMGNTNASRNPWATFWRRRALRPEHRWVLRLVADYVPALVSDKGGEENVSAAELRVMELAATARACWALAMAAGDLDAVARFIAAEVQALRSIGLQRRSRPVPSLREVMASTTMPAAGEKLVG